MCFHSQSIAQKVMDHLLELGTNSRHALIIHRTSGGSYRTAWYVTITDRVNIANVMNDIVGWHADKTAKWDFTHLNAKREQFGLPELEPSDIQQADRKMQRHFSDPEITAILEEDVPIPGEEEAQARLD